MKRSPAKVMQSSQLAQLAGISVDTLRYYGRNRLLPAAQRSLSGYRLFPPEAFMPLRVPGVSIPAVAQIEFLEWTAGDRLRHAKFAGLRDDKNPRSVVKENRDKS